jgi:hypothetical protein
MRAQGCRTGPPARRMKLDEEDDNEKLDCLQSHQRSGSIGSPRDNRWRRDCGRGVVDGFRLRDITLVLDA